MTMPPPNTWAPPEPDTSTGDPTAAEPTPEPDQPAAPPVDDRPLDSNAHAGAIPPTPPERRRTAGRPTKFTPEVRHRLLSAIQSGCHRPVACQFAGITHQTLRNWLKLAEDPQAPPEYLDFLVDLERVEAEAEVVDLTILRTEARKGEWRAAAWRLERRHPDRWGRVDRSQVTVTGADGGPVEMRVQVGADPLSIEALATRLAARAEARADADVLDARVVDTPELGGGERIMPGSMGVSPGQRVGMDRVEVEPAGDES